MQEENINKGTFWAQRLLSTWVVMIVKTATEILLPSLQQWLPSCINVVLLFGNFLKYCTLFRRITVKGNDFSDFYLSNIVKVIYNLLLLCINVGTNYIYAASDQLCAGLLQHKCMKCMKSIEMRLKLL